jgi:hypothetical protein
MAESGDNNIIAPVQVQQQVQQQINIIDKNAYDVLNVKLEKVKEELAQHNTEFEKFCSQPTMVKIKKYITFDGNHCKKITPHEYNLIEDTYKSKLSPLNPKIIGFNKHIENVKKMLVDVTHEITKLANLRDKEPNLDVKVVRDYEKQIAKIEEEKAKLILSIEKPEILKDYPYYQIYDNDACIISKEYNRYVNKVNPLKKLIALLETEIAKELWRDRYMTYAKENNLEVDEENIFRVCNKHWYDGNINAKNIDITLLDTSIGIIHCAVKV